MAPLTVDERSFQNPKLGAGTLTAYKAFADLAAKGSLLVVTVAAARLLPAEDFGVFSLGATLGWIAAVASDGGMQLHVARAIARRPADAAAVRRAWLRVRIATAAASVAIAALIVFVVGWRGERATALVALLLVYSANGIVEFLYYVCRGLSRTDVESSLTLWQRAAMLVCALAVLAWRHSLVALTFAMLAPALATAAAALRVTQRIAAETAAADTATDAVRLGSIRDVWPIGAGIVLSALYFRVDVFLVQHWSGTEAVGLYNAVFRLVEALRLFPAAAIAVALPTLCRGRDFSPLARLAVPTTVAATAAAAALAATAAWSIPLVYPAPYAAAVPAFRILLLAFPLMTLNMALTHQLIAWDGQRAYALVCGLALALNVAVNARLVPALSIDGAAWATLATEVFVTGGCACAIWIAAARVRGAHLAETAVAG